MANITFTTATGRDAYLHMRIGPIAVHPGDRGTSNTVVKVGEPAAIPVNDGNDIWYCFGNQIVLASEDPELCCATIGTSISLTRDRPCFVDN